ncbi:trihelix transcription factor DF1-like [Primulina eburnea]|uniref:trihelix transcription factor DF1-like n=1 Tax=Primulina eburnea TaxID=1245227 RepID=UPI003C6BE213
MMLGVSGLMGSSGDGAAAADALEGGGASGGSSEVGASSSIPGGSLEDGERSGGGGGGNRWPRQETLALLKIRSDMDVAFRDSSLKGPLWDEVSRKMAELGFHRSAKKCKEKFENVYKYHKRTKDGRASKPDGKTYRFFDQLQALETSPPLPFTPPPPRTQTPATTTMTAPPPNAANFPMPSHVGTVPSISPNPLSMLPPNTTIQTSLNPINNIPSFQPSINTSNLPQTHPFQSSHDPHILSSLLSDSSSSSTSSDEDIQRRRGKKRKWKDFFERLMKEVVQKQEELQKKFLETLEKRERDRMAREEAWRIQETTRMNREHDLLVQERSIAAAKDAAVIAFLQKVSEQHNLQIPNISNIITAAVQPPENPQPPPRQPAPPPQPPPQQSTHPPPPAQPTLPIVTVSPGKILNPSKKDNGGTESFTPTSSSRWPKTEIEALIKLRTNLDLKYQENGPKGPLWEEISTGMGKMGYSRSSKRCKEKWENINKYYKKVKESSKKRPEDSKTCPYFQQLEALYREKNKNDDPSFHLEYTAKQDNPMVPIMARPERQWPNPNQQHQDPTMHDQDQDNESDNNEEDDDGDDEDEEDAGGYEIVTNKQQSSMTNTAE